MRHVVHMGKLPPLPREVRPVVLAFNLAVAGFLISGIFAARDLEDFPSFDELHLKESHSEKFQSLNCQ